MITLEPVQVLTITVPRVRRILDFLLPGLSRRNRSGHSLADRNLAMKAFVNRRANHIRGLHLGSAVQYFSPPVFPARLRRKAIRSRYIATRPLNFCPIIGP